MKKMHSASETKARAFVRLLSVLLLLWAPAAGRAQAPGWAGVAPSNTPKWVGFSVMINNKMYVFSGFDNGSVHTTPKCEVYDPVANTWAYLADMPNPVTHAGIAVDGTKVYVAGGFLGGLVGDPNADLLQIYDVPTNTWSTGPKLPARSGGNALVRVGRQLHSFGGMLDDRQTGATAHYVLDLGNVAAGWATAAGLPTPRCHFASACVAGKIYAMGGQTGHDGPIADVGLVQVYDPSTDAWTRLKDMPYVRSHSEPATFVLDGKVYLAGGRSGRPNGADNVLNTVTSYDPGLDAWTEQVPLPVRLFGPAAEAIGSELIVSNGGLDYATNPQTTARKIGLTLAPTNKIGFLPGALHLTAAAGAAATKTALLWTLSGNPAYTIAPGTLPAWLSVGPAAGTVDLLGGTEVKVTASAGALAAGTYTATVTAKATGYPDATLSVAFTVSGAKPKVLYLYGSIPPGIHDMRLADAGDRGMSQFNQALIAAGLGTAEAQDVNVTLDAATLANYKVVVLGSNNRRFTAAERTAVASWVNAGGGLVAWTDGAFGGGTGGLSSAEGPQSDNDLTEQFGMHFLHDNGLGVFALNQWAVDHYLNKFNKNAGLTIEGEGVSPVRTSAPATVVAYLPAGKNQLNPLDGPLTPADAALAVAKVGQGRVAGFFDRNAFWNNGEGTTINRVDNKAFAQRLILWASGVDDSNPLPPAAPVASAGPDQTLTLPTSSAVLAGAGAAAGGRTIAGYTWSQVSGPTTAAFSSKTVAGPTVSGLAAGSYVFALVVSDNAGAASAASQVTVVVNPAPAAGGAVVYRLKAGGGALNTSLGAFAADQYYTAATSYVYSTTSAIAGTPNPALYQSERSSSVDKGAFGYALPVANGAYTVVLHFAEIYWSRPGQRLFDVRLEGTKVLDNYDIIAKVGPFAATTETFAATVADGVLNVDFSSGLADGGIDRPKISAIEVYAPASTGAPVASAGPNQTITLPTSSVTLAGSGTAAGGRTVTGYAWSQVSGPSTATLSGAATATLAVSGLAAGGYVFALVVSDNAGASSAPSQVTVAVNPAPAGAVVYRLKAGGGALDTSVGAFAADQYFSPAPGNTYATTAGIAGTADPALYQTERYGTEGQFAYALPVANGAYTVVLHFAEIYWWQAGQRVFDVGAEGAKVLAAYDIYQKAGGHAATTETFAVTVADGVLNLTFSSLGAGGVDQPKLAALAVLTAPVAAARGGAPALVAGPLAASGPGRAFPVPTADGRVRVQWAAGAGQPLHYALVSALGAVVAAGERPAGAPADALSFNFAGAMAAPGVYYLLLDAPGANTRLKLLRQ